MLRHFFYRHKVACPIATPLNRSLENLQLLDGDLSQQFDSLAQRFKDVIESFRAVFRKAVSTRIENIAGRHRLVRLDPFDEVFLHDLYKFCT